MAPLAETHFEKGSILLLDKSPWDGTRKLHFASEIHVLNNNQQEGEKSGYFMGTHSSLDQIRKPQIKSRFKGDQETSLSCMFSGKQRRKQIKQKII